MSRAASAAPKPKTVAEAPAEPQTLADLWVRLGRIPLERIRLHPAPGTATEDDVVRVDEHENRLCELVDGTLVEKAMGAEESNVAWLIGSFIGAYLAQNTLGTCLGVDGFLRIEESMLAVRTGARFVRFHGQERRGVAVVHFFVLALSHRPNPLVTVGGHRIQGRHLTLQHIPVADVVHILHL